MAVSPPAPLFDDAEAAAIVASLPRPRAVVYDWDNTLADNWGAIVAAMNHTLETFGLEPWSASEARRRIKQSLRDSFPVLFGDRWESARETYYAHFAAHHLEHLHPMPGAVALMDALAARGVYQAVVSNKTGRYLRAEAEAMGWTNRFGRLVGANDASADKPDPAPVRMALEPGGMSSGSNVWFIGDSDIDMLCANAAGLVGILIPVMEDGGVPEPPRDGSVRPVLTISSCSTLAALV